MPSSGSSSGRRRVEGLDALRLVLAVEVVVKDGLDALREGTERAGPLETSWRQLGWIEQMLRAVGRLLSSGASEARGLACSGSRCTAAGGRSEGPSPDGLGPSTSARAAGGRPRQPARSHNTSAQNRSL